MPNYKLMLLAFIISMFIWTQLRLLKYQETEVSLPVKLINVSEVNKAPAALPKEITYQVGGRGIDILLLILSSTSVEIDAGQLEREGTGDVVSSGIVHVPRYVKLAKLEPVASVKEGSGREVLTTRRVPIKIDFQNEAAENLYLQHNKAMDVSTVEIAGVTEAVNEIREVKTRQVTRQMLDRDSLQVDLIKPGKGLQLSVSQVVIRTGNERRIVQTFSLIPIRCLIPGKSVMPSFLSIKIQGPATLINHLKPEAISAVVQKENLDHEGNATVHIQLPQNLQIIDYTPQKVQIVGQ